MVRSRPGTVIGVFEDQRHALQAFHGLVDAGFRSDEVGLVARRWMIEDEPLPDQIDVNLQRRAGEGALTGTVAGAGIGAAAGLLGVALLPGGIPVVAGGLVISALGGAAIGAAGGAFLGPFLAMELTEEEAERHAQHVENDRTVVVVRTNDRQEEAESILLKHGAYDDSMRAGL